MKIISWNVNGLRAVYKKNFLDWLRKSKADIVCLQEIKAQEEQLPLDLINPVGYFSHFNPAVKKGYSGTAVFTKEKPLKIEKELGFGRFDQEGRVLELKYPQFSLINLYLPHGGRSKENLDYKLECYKILLNYLKRIQKHNIVAIGDFNIAHQETDLSRPKQNKNNIMFTEQEREKIEQIVKLGFVDTFRKFNQQGGNYTWWPYFANARERNLGWRIDYAFVSKSLVSKLKNAFISDKVMGSDHCPIGIDI